MPSAVEDCQSAVEDRHGSRRRKAKGQRQEIAAAAEVRRVGPVGRRAQHAQDFRRSTDRSTEKLCLQEPNSLLFWVDR